MRRRLLRSAATMLALTVVLAGCADSSPGSDREAARSARESPAASRTPEPPTAGELAVRRMTLREKAGQVIVASWSGTGSPAPMVRKLHLGGVIALGDNFASAQQIRHANRRVSRVVRQRGYPAFLAVDQEGGLVSRAGGNAVRFPAFMSVGAADDTRLTRRAAGASAAQMRGLGFNVVFSPVADVTSGGADAIIGSRAAGGRPELVARHVVAATRGIEGSGVLPVVKHFPGHGSLSIDSHRSLPVLHRGLRKLRRTDLVPFRAAVEAGAPAVMTGHIAVPALGSKAPASISRPLTTGLLRRQLGFHGLVVTDALNMGGVQQRAPGARAAVRALRAGADVALMPPDPRAARDRIVRAVRNGDLRKRRLDEAAARMIDTLRALRASGATGTRRAEAASHQLSAEALTSVAGPCKGRLVPGRVRVEGPAEDVARFEATMAARGVTIAHDTTKQVRDGTRRKLVKFRKEWVRKKVKVKGKKKKQVRRVRVKVPVYKKIPVYKTVVVRADAPTVALAGPGDTPRGPVDVLVALDRPDVLGRVGARVELATYGDTGGAMRALADVLMGDAEAPGRLPVAVPGVERSGC